MRFTKPPTLAIALLACLLAPASGCASAPARAARTADPPPPVRADQLQTRSPDRIAGAPQLAPEPLRPVPVPLDTAVAGSPPPRR